MERIPLSKVRLPFLLGKAGSPCGLYKDLIVLKNKNEFWQPYIEFGEFASPKSCNKQ